MKRFRHSLAFFIGIFIISTNFGVNADEWTPLNCPAQTNSIWPPHDQLECRAPAGEKSWPPSDYVDVPELSLYKFYKFGTDWFTANRICQEDGAHLVIIDSENEMKLMLQFFNENRDVVGASGIDHIWLGIHERGVHGKFFTVFGDKVEDLGYTIPWLAGQPNDVGLDDCASLYRTGVLYDDPCIVVEKYPFVCEIERSATKYVQDHPTLYPFPETLCNGQSCQGLDGHRSIYWTDLYSPNAMSWSPRDYLVDCKGPHSESSWPPYDYSVDLQQRSYYKVHTFGTNWFTAMTTCEQEGAHLLMVSSHAEAEATVALMKKYPTVQGAAAGHVWVGTHERGTHAQFVDTFGDPLDSNAFMVWSKSPPQPNDAGLDDCISFHNSLTVYDDAWSLSYYFICEIEISAVESLKNSSKHNYVFSPVCNDRTCSRLPKYEVQEAKPLTPTFKIDARKPPARGPKLSAGKKPIKVVARPSSKLASKVQGDSGDSDLELKYTALIKSLVLKTNYTAPDIRCQHIPFNFNGGFCQSSSCSSPPTSCDNKKESALLHSMFNDIKAIKKQLQATSISERPVVSSTERPANSTTPKTSGGGSTWVFQSRPQGKSGTTPKPKQRQ